MKYAIELTNKQKAQMDCMMEIVHRYVGFNPKLEPIKATNVEDTSEYQIGYKVGLEEADATNTDLIDELKQVEYIRGLEDGYKGYKHLEQWFAETCFYDDEDNLFPEYKRRQADTCCLEDIITDVGLSEVLKRVKAYEEKEKAEKEIKVGDEVICNCPNEQRVIITSKYDGWVTFMRKDGVCYSRAETDMKKTGRHFDEVSQLLDKLRGLKE